jgi:hypothetical protein
MGGGDNESDNTRRLNPLGSCNIVRDDVTVTNIPVWARLLAAPFSARGALTVHLGARSRRPRASSERRFQKSAGRCGVS